MAWLTFGPSTCVTVLLMGAGIIVVSLIGGEPGFGVLAAFVVYVFNLSLLSYGLRALRLAVLIVAHMICIVTIGRSGLWTRVEM